MLIRRAEIEGVAGLDLRTVGGRIAEIGPRLDLHPQETVLDAAGGALLAGLHDHHIHLFALAAAQSSVRCGPPTVRNRAELERALRTASGSDTWIRGIGYHESVSGPLDRAGLDALVPDRPVRIQHRSGALWMLNSRAVDQLGLDAGTDHGGVERDAHGRASGRLFRLDRWLRERIGAPEPPNLSEVGRRLASYGVTGLTDATPGNAAAELEAFLAALERGELPQRLVLMGRADLPEIDDARVTRGALKLLLDDASLPELEELQRQIEQAHANGRPVAVHCVTRTQLFFALAGFAAVGVRAGDRIEHASVTPPDALEHFQQLPLTVVTQPGFVYERGDAYMKDVDAVDLPWLYRCRGFLEASVPLGGGTDAPFGEPDPWLAMRAAVERRTYSGAALGPEEAVSPERALALFTSPAEAPGAAPRALAVGAAADLCLLDRPWAVVREELCSEHVAATIRAGELIFQGGKQVVSQKAGSA